MSSAYIGCTVKVYGFYILKGLNTCDGMALVNEGECQIKDEQDGAEAVSLHNAQYCFEFFYIF